MNKPDCKPIEDAEYILDNSTLYNWLQAKAKQYQLQYLLAHADDGVIWGHFDKDGNLTTPNLPKELFPNSQELFPKCKFPVLRSHTLQQCRAFGENAEVMLWKIAQDDWKARLIKDDNKPEYLPDEHQILWGTQKEGENKGFTLVSDGQQGLRHAVPLIGIPFKNNERPLRLTVRHYIDYDDTGVARIYLSRLVNLYY
jgi:CRISPR-associated protein (TIGR03984 family)